MMEVEYVTSAAVQSLLWDGDCSSSAILDHAMVCKAYP